MFCRYLISFVFMDKHYSAKSTLMGHLGTVVLFKLSSSQEYQATGNTLKAVAEMIKNGEIGVGTRRAVIRVAVLHVLDNGGLRPGTMQCMESCDGGVGGECLAWKRCLMAGGWYRVQCWKEFIRLGNGRCFVAWQKVLFTPPDVSSHHSMAVGAGMPCHGNKLV